jgi:formylglycine-generating enzyme required for sulfatase activity
MHARPFDARWMQQRLDTLPLQSPARFRRGLAARCALAPLMLLLGACAPPVGDTAAPSASDSGPDTWGITLVEVAAGSFNMGSGASDPDDIYIDRRVTLTHDFSIATTETTRRQWEAYPPNADWEYEADWPACTTSTTSATCPAEGLPWPDVARYCNGLSAELELTPCYLEDGSDVADAFAADIYACPGFRLPTDAEWEFAARGGQDLEFSGSDSASAVAWTKETAADRGTYAHEVATLAPNAWGLYDMSGNASEWTQDWYDFDMSGAAVVDPMGPPDGSVRVFRSGDWTLSDEYARVSSRNGAAPGSPFLSTGFRIVRTIEP